jgi:hypothetical protein
LLMVAFRIIPKRILCIDRDKRHSLDNQPHASAFHPALKLTFIFSSPSPAPLI